jgi:alpha-tubulin suppressor-like RCC1 family protein
MSLFLTKQAFNIKSDILVLFKFKILVLCFGIFLSLILIGCGSEESSGNASKDETKLSMISAGEFHSLISSNESKFYAAGFHGEGQLGLGDNTFVEEYSVFTEVPDLGDKNIAVVAAGGRQSFVLLDDKVYAAGDNSNGQLGLGSDNTIYDTFTEIADLNDKNIIAVAVGKAHSFALSKSGKVYMAGDNNYGQLGLGDSDNRDTFTEVSDLGGKNIIAIAAGHFHSFALSNDGMVYAAGWNENAQLGLGDNVSRNVFTEITDLKDKNITAIAAGRLHSFALSKGGKVYAVGLNENGQLGLGDNVSRNTFTEITNLRDKNITAIAAGRFHSFALSNEGKVYAAGNNENGQLGLNDEDNRNSFTEVSDLADKNITAVTTGEFHSFISSNESKFYSAGASSYGQLGVGDRNSRSVFTEISIP